MRICKMLVLAAAWMAACSVPAWADPTPRTDGLSVSARMDIQALIPPVELEPAGSAPGALARPAQSAVPRSDPEPKPEAAPVAAAPGAGDNTAALGADATAAVRPDNDEDDDDDSGPERDDPPDWIGAAQAQPRPLRPLVVPENRNVERAVRFFLTRKRAVLERGYRRSGRFLPMMQAIFAEEGVPVELAYLAAVESNYNPTAHSRSRAAGLWQFMRGTARKYGLRVHLPWYDERLDPLYSTRAAARLLANLHDIYRSWELALAAYNAGERSVNRAIRRARQPEGGEDFWKLRRLPRETKGYVPAFFALARIYHQPEQYGLDELEQEPALAIEVVRLEVPASLAELARRLELPTAELQRLNPAWRRGVIPPFGFEPVLLHVPRGQGRRLVAALAAEPLPPVQWREHIVRKGETLSGIAQMYRIPLAELLALNPGRRRLLSIGQPVILPLPKQVTAMDKFVIAAAGPQATLLEPAAAAGNGPAAPDSHTAGNAPAALAAAATLAGPPVAKAGRTPGSAPQAPQMPDAPQPLAPASPPPEAPAAPVHPQAQGQTTVQTPSVAPVVPTVVVTPVALVPVPAAPFAPGAFPGSTSPAAKREPATASVAQPGPAGAAPPDKRATVAMHRVQPGDTLWSISRKYGVRVSDLKRWNRLRSNRLHPAEVLAVQGTPSGS